MEQSKKKRINYRNKYIQAVHKLERESKKLQEREKEVVSLNDELKQRKEEIEFLDLKANSHLDHSKRLKAEYENYKKRAVKERQQMVLWAVEDFVKELLPVLDNFERAINSSRSSQDFSSLLEGIQLVSNQFKSVLERQGLREIEAEGRQFDPYLHEAIMQIESNDYPDNSVVEELQRGYKLKDKILRPSMVKVNKRGDFDKSEKKKSSE